MEAIGIKREDVADNSDVDVWPENWVPFLIFSAAATQWRTGASGAIGLDYMVIKWFMEIHKVKAKQRADTLRAIMSMESVALQFMNKKR